MYVRTVVILLCGILVVLGSTDGSVLLFSSTKFPFNFKQVNEFLNRTSYEAVSVMVFFQIIAISFVIGKFSTLYLLMWLSFSFLVYNLAGPYFCLKWLLLISSLIWYFVVFLWTHPYLIACTIFSYGVYYIIVVWWTDASDHDSDLKVELVLDTLEEINNKTSALQKELLQLSKSVENLQMQTFCSEKEDYVEDWLTDIPYPLDRRRDTAKKTRSQHSHSLKNK